MPHPIFGAPSHDLERIEAKLILPTLANSHTTTLAVTGETSTKRSSLWAYAEAFRPDQIGTLLEATQQIEWVMGIAAQDRPVTQQGLQRALLPGGWEDRPLF